MKTTSWIRRLLPVGLGFGIMLAAGTITFAAASPHLVSPGPCATHTNPAETTPGPVGGGGSGGSGGC